MNRTRRLSPREIARAARERSAQMRSSHPDAVPCVIEEKVGDGRYKVKRDSWPFSILVPVTPASADIRTPIRWMLCFEDGNRQLPFVHWPERPSKFLDPGAPEAPATLPWRHLGSYGLACGLEHACPVPGETWEPTGVVRSWQSLLWVIGDLAISEGITTVDPLTFEYVVSYECWRWSTGEVLWTQEVRSYFGTSGVADVAVEIDLGIVVISTQGYAPQHTFRLLDTGEVLATVAGPVERYQDVGDYNGTDTAGYLVTGVAVAGTLADIDLHTEGRALSLEPVVTQIAPPAWRLAPDLAGDWEWNLAIDVATLGQLVATPGPGEGAYPEGTRLIAAYSGIDYSKRRVERIWRGAEGVYRNSEGEVWTPGSSLGGGGEFAPPASWARELIEYERLEHKISDRVALVVEVRTPGGVLLGSWSREWSAGGHNPAILGIERASTQFAEEMADLEDQLGWPLNASFLSHPSVANWTLDEAALVPGGHLATGASGGYEIMPGESLQGAATDARGSAFAYCNPSNWRLEFDLAYFVNSNDGDSRFDGSVGLDSCRANGDLITLTYRTPSKPAPYYGDAFFIARQWTGARTGNYLSCGWRSGFGSTFVGVPGVFTYHPTYGWGHQGFTSVNGREEGSNSYPVNEIVGASGYEFGPLFAPHPTLEFTDAAWSDSLFDWVAAEEAEAAGVSCLDWSRDFSYECCPWYLTVQQGGRAAITLLRLNPDSTLTEIITREYGGDVQGWNEQAPPETHQPVVNAYPGRGGAFVGRHEHAYSTEGAQWTHTAVVEYWDREAGAVVWTHQLGQDETLTLHGGHDEAQGLDWALVREDQSGAVHMVTSAGYVGPVTLPGELTDCAIVDGVLYCQAPDGEIFRNTPTP